MRRISLGILALGLAACQSASDTPPPPAAPPPPPRAGAAVLDSSVTVIPPESAVPKRYAAFSGVWTGSWDGVSFDARLAVRSVAANGRVEATYAWGTLGDIKPGTADGKGRISGSMLKLERFANGGDTTFTMQPDGTLAGTYRLGELSFTGVFRKQ